MYITRSGQQSSKKHHHVSQFENNTSSFRKKDVESLNIHFVDEPNINNIVDLSNIKIIIPDDLLLKNVDNPSMNDEYNNDEKSLIQVLDLVSENQNRNIDTEESRTDTFVSYLLGEMEFNKYPLMLRNQPMYKFSIHDKIITSIYDFSVEKKKEILLVQEDKHSKNTSVGRAWGEHQLAGEFVAAAYNNLNKLPEEYLPIIYGIRVVGLQFTFYKAVIPTSYIVSLGDGFPEEDVYIYRFPPQGNSMRLQSLNYLVGEDRKIILSMLSAILQYFL